MCLSCTVTDIYSASNTVVTLKSGIGVVHGHWKWQHSKAFVYTVSYSHSIATMAASLAVSIWCTNVTDAHPASPPAPCDSEGRAAKTTDYVTLATFCVWRSGATQHIIVGVAQGRQLCQPTERLIRSRKETMKQSVTYILTLVTWVSLDGIGIWRISTIRYAEIYMRSKTGG